MSDPEAARMTVAIIPARGGSQGVKRKCLRLIGGVPLVARSVAAALAAESVTRVIVSTDDPEIAAVAKHAGAQVIDRGHSDADETVADVVAQVVAYTDTDGPVVVLQPSSPFTDAVLIDAAVACLDDADSVATVAPVVHGAWSKDGPLHDHSVNRQYATPHAWVETGAVQAVRQFPASGGPLSGAPLVGESHHLFDPAEEMGCSGLQAERYALDVDTPADFAMAQDLASRGSVDFLLTAGDDTGSGHLHRCLTLADELAAHDVTFTFLAGSSEWAQRAVKERGYRESSDDTPIPSVSVVDCLEGVPERAIVGLRSSGSRVVVLECLDPAVCDAADLAVNALYSGPGLAGPMWEPLRPEFSVAPARESGDRLNVLVSFGGTDPSHLTERFAQVVQAALARVPQPGTLRVLWPPGREKLEGLALPFTCWEGSVSEALAWADIAVTSAGRTVLEAAAMGCPTVAVCAHERESLHAPVPGVYWMGHHAGVSDEQVGAVLCWLAANPAEREARSRRAAGAVDPAGATTRLGAILDRMVRER